LNWIDVGNPASNVIPATARATLNIRFNDLHSGASLSDWLHVEADKVRENSGIELDLEVHISGESFLTPPGPLSELVSRAVAAECGITPRLSTSGGTSDARFIKEHCPVVEFGLVGSSMHQVDEFAETAQIHQLKEVYSRVLRDYFA
jgi:succinyl-diaminopimelate desuccinylase